MDALLSREIIVSKTHCRVFVVLAAVMLTALGAFVRIWLPFSPVPITMQTFFVLLCGALLGARLGGLTQGGYLLAGCAGLPLFSGAACGILYLAGPTAGYLVGFLPAALAAGALLGGRSVSFWKAAGCLLLADCLIFCCGVFWLKIITASSWPQLLLIGVVPFVPGELLKIGAAASIYRSAGTRMREVLL